MDPPPDEIDDLEAAALRLSVATELTLEHARELIQTTGVPADQAARVLEGLAGEVPSLDEAAIRIRDGAAAILGLDPRRGGGR